MNNTAAAPKAVRTFSGNMIHQAAAEQAAFETEMANARFAASVERGRRDERARRNTWPAKRYGCPCAQCRHS